MIRYQVYDKYKVCYSIVEKDCENDPDDYVDDYELKVGDKFMVDGWTYIDDLGFEHELNHYELEVIAIQSNKVLCKFDDDGDIENGI